MRYIRKPIPAMTSTKVHDYLRKLGKEWTGQGIAMELGCWMGASSVPLLEGLVTAGYTLPFFAYDRWVANTQQVDQSRGILYPNDDVMPHYKRNVRRVYNNVRTFKGLMPDTINLNHPQQKIEICIFDAPKKEPVFTQCMKLLLPWCIPGVTTFGLLDYRFWEDHTDFIKRKMYRAPVNFMDKYGQHFGELAQWDNESPVFFKYLTELKL